ncbi:MAG: adenylate/guanylate cyclase domain-containing protein [Neomegalonema sp.]|nr:adenylate/guanylate cyclase domain-containing protein [Neomegalonema sp.]
MQDPQNKAEKSDEPPARERRRRRRLRAILAADVAGFSGHVSTNETGALRNLSSLRLIAEEELEFHDGWLFGMPGDGIFAIFESAIDALNCALGIQQRMMASSGVGAMQLRVGIHMGEVLFEGDLPFGETLAIAARLEALADTGGILVSQAVVDAVASRVPVGFERRGAPKLKNLPRQVLTYAVVSQGAAPASPEGVSPAGEKPVYSPDGSGPVEAIVDLRAQNEIAHPPPEPPMERPAPPPGAAELDRTARLIKPRPGAIPATPPAAPATALRLELDQLTILKTALATALGPVAAVMVERRAKKAASLQGLIEDLAEAIPNEAERSAFLVAAKKAG